MDNNNVLKRDRKENKREEKEKEKRDRKEKKKKDNNKCININNNIIRKMSNYLYDKLNIKSYKLTQYYTLLHDVFVFIVSFIFIFNTNLFFLGILLLIVSLDAFSIVVLHMCPLTLLEMKYLKTSSCEIRNEYLQNSGILYNCNHEYEKQIELLVNIWLLIAGKCIIIIFLRTFHIKIHNFNSIYSI